MLVFSLIGYPKCLVSKSVIYFTSKQLFPQNLPDIRGDGVILVRPWYGTIDCLTVHIEPVPETSQPFLKDWNDATRFGRTNVDQHVSPTAVL